MRKPWMGAAYWLDPVTSSACLLVEPMTPTGIAPTTRHRALYHQPLIKKMPYRSVYDPIF